MKTVIFSFFTLVGTVGFAAEVLISTGEVFTKDGKEKKFTYERFQDKQGDKTLDRAVYKDLDGDVLTEEKMQRVAGKMIRYDMDQKQLRQKAWIEVADGKVTYNLKKVRKNNYPQTVKLKDNFIVGLQIVDSVHSNWDMFLNGQTLDVGLGVWHRQETIGFKLSRESMDDKQLVVKMNPSSMFIRAVVSPIYFTFDKKTKNLVSYKGRTTPKNKKGRDFYDFDGLVKYKTVGAVAKIEETKKTK